MIQPKTFGIWGNTDKTSFWETLPDILSWADENYLVAHLTTRIIQDEKCPDSNRPSIQSKEDMSSLDFMLVLGGDGTFLSFFMLCTKASFIASAKVIILSFLSIYVFH